jgi:hypothetical protein
VGKDKQMRLCESLINSKVSSNQPEELTKEENMENILMIGRIKIFLPFAQGKAEICVADEATTAEEELPIVTVKKKEKLEQTLEVAQAEDDENSEEWLDTFSQVAERTAAFELAKEEEEEANSISFANLCEQIEALERRVMLQGMHIQQVKLEETEEEGMGDHDDLPNFKQIFQLRRLNEQSQPLEQFDEVIEEIRQLMTKSARTASEE